MVHHFFYLSHHHNSSLERYVRFSSILSKIATNKVQVKNKCEIKKIVLKHLFVCNAACSLFGTELYVGTRLV